MTAADLGALQAAVQGENAAVFGYGQAAGAFDAAAVGGSADLARARLYLDAHRSQRDRLQAMVVDEGATPTAAAPSYVVPPTASAAEARAVLAGIESRLASTYADLVAASSGATRAFAVSGLQGCAVRTAAWGGGITVYPGLPERATTSPSASASTPATGIATP